MVRKPWLILIRGLPGAGKSTAARERLPAFRHLEADMFFMVDGSYRFDPSKLREAHEWCQRETFAALARGEDVVVTNTFSRVWEMEPYAKFGATGAVVDLFDAGLSDAQLAARNVHNVPQTTIAAMRRRWER